MAISRNYSFLRKTPEVFDEISINGKGVIIPARLGSIFWAVLRVAYGRCNQPIYPDQLAEAVQELMLDRDSAAWQAHCEKPNRKPWRERLMLNAMMLTRTSGNNRYGLRLAERGHALSMERDGKVRTYFILRTNPREVRH